MNKKQISMIVLLLLLLMSSGCKQDNNINVGKEVVLRLTPKKANPRNSEGDFIRLKNGDILFIYTHFTGGTGDHASAYLASRISKDSGKSWSESDEIVVPNEAEMNVMSVSLIRLQNDKIALFYLRKNSDIDCLPIMRISSDEGSTWSEPKVCIGDPGYYVLNNDRVVQLKNGRIILPVAQHNSPDFVKRHSGLIMCYYSDDNGMTWNKSNPINNPDNVTTQEPGIVELLDDRLFLFCRTDAGVQFTSYSNDKGNSWSQLIPGNIKSPLSPASIERIPRSNDLLLVWNNNYERGKNGGRRTPFNVAVSKDEAISWENMKTIESDPNGWYCYTAIEFVKDYVLLAHCAGDRKKNGGLETTQITRLSIDWLYKPAYKNPYVKNDREGMVELGSDETNSIIYYSLDGLIPDSITGIRYLSPISIDHTTQIYYQAFGEEGQQSSIMTDYVGTDIFQIPTGKEGEKYLSGLKYLITQGELNSTSEISNSNVLGRGISLNISANLVSLDSNFAIIFEGYIDVKTKGRYTFYLESNDGSILKLNNNLIIDNDGPHGALEKKVSTSLLVGKHKIIVKYFQQGGGKMLTLKWDGPQFGKSLIPDLLLFH